MSVRRSPPGTPTPTVQEQPDLRVEPQPQLTSTRKRKQPESNDCCKRELATFRDEILEILTNHSRAHNTHLENISNDTSAIKEKILNIEQKAENILLEQNKLKTEMKDLKECYDKADKRIKSLEDEIVQLKCSDDTSSSRKDTKADVPYEDIILEMNERTRRARNVIVTGIPELNSVNKNDRKDHDIKEVAKVFRKIGVDIPDPVTCFRLGKYQPNKPRPIKVIYTSHEIVKNILRKRSNMSLENVKIYSDNTIKQQKHLKSVQEELNIRRKNGEMNLVIKYIQGIPKIIEIEPKN